MDGFIEKAYSLVQKSIICEKECVYLLAEKTINNKNTIK